MCFSGPLLDQAVKSGLLLGLWVDRSALKQLSYQLGEIGPNSNCGGGSVGKRMWYAPAADGVAAIIPRSWNNPTAAPFEQTERQTREMTMSPGERR